MFTWQLLIWRAYCGHLFICFVTMINKHDISLAPVFARFYTFSPVFHQFQANTHVLSLFTHVLLYLLILPIFWLHDDLRDSVYIGFFIICNTTKLIHCFLHKQGSSENDGRSDVHYCSEFKVFSNCSYTNCCYPNFCHSNFSHLT